MPLGFFSNFCLKPRYGMGLGLLVICLTGLLCAFLVTVEVVLAQDFGIVLPDESDAVYRKLPDIENQLYGHSYSEQAVSQRINRIERTLFGFAQRGPLQVRMQAIESRIKEKHSQAVRAEQEPMLVYLEEKLFQRAYPEKSTAERLHQLEIQVFGRSFDSYPIEIRMKKLTYAMPVMAREIRLSKGDSVIASTGRVSRKATRSAGAKLEAIQLDAAGTNVRLQPDGAPLGSGNYLPSIYREASGQVMRWPNLPIKVYLNPADAEASLGVQVLQAWKPVFSVQQVTQSAQADVIVTWDRANWEQDTMGLLTRPVVHVNEAHNIRTVIMVSLYPLKGQSPDRQLQVLSHELGHAFGLWGHSDDPGDVMYPGLRQEMNDFPSPWSWRTAATNTRVQPSDEVEGFQPSQRDINTLLKIYGLPARDIGSYSPY